MKTTTAKQSKSKQPEQMHISGAEAIIHCLLAEGVDLIYGYPGGAIMPIYDELYKFKDQLNHVLTRHEQGPHNILTVLFETVRGCGETCFHYWKNSATYYNHLFCRNCLY